MAIQGGRPNNRQIVPYLFVNDGEGALAFYRRAFRAETLYKSPMPGGNGIFAMVKIGESTIQVADDCCCQPEIRVRSPEALGGTSAIIEMHVDDVDAAFDRAVNAGALPSMAPHDAFWGDRYAWVTDPYGHLWALSTVIETISPEEVKRRMDEMLAQMNCCGDQGA